MIVRIAGDDVEGDVVAEEHEKRERHEQVVNRRDHRAQRETELEAQADVDEDAGEREDGRQHALPLQLLPDDRARRPRGLRR